MIIDLTQQFRDKVSAIKPLNKRTLAKEIGVDYDRMNKWLGAGINIKDAEDRAAVERWITGTSKNNSKNNESKDTVDYKTKYIEQLENNNAFLSSQVKANQTIVDEKEQRIKSLEDVVSSLTAQIAEKNEIIGRLKIMDTNLNVVLKTLSTRQTKQAAS